MLYVNTEPIGSMKGSGAMAFDVKHSEPVAPATQAPDRPASAPDPAKPARNPLRRVALLAVLAAALGYGAIMARDYWTVGRFMERTDDAYLKADIAELSPEVTGHVSAVAVVENQAVKAGDVLFRIDDGDYRIALEQAQSQIATHTETLKRILAQIDAARAAVGQAEATRQAADAGLTNAKATEARVRSLNTSSYASQSQLDDAVAALATAEADRANAAAAVTSANANVAVLQAQYAEAEAGSRALELAEEQAQRNLDRTEIRAPFDGVVANIAAKAGELVSPGTMLAAVVPAGSLYVEANFKETQLARIRDGARAEIAFDVLPGVSVEGRVASIAPATGANFSLLPPENATGNFTKIVQRVPVRIDLPAGAVADEHLRAGLSVIVSVDSRPGEPAAAGEPGGAAAQTAPR